MRVLCFGLDGADYDLVNDLVARGRMPTVARLTREGAFGALRSTLPAVTPTAWSSFLTGLNPGGHGIFYFTTNPNRAQSRVENAASRGGAPFWHALGAAGMRSAFIGIPFTYPPDPIDGILVTGYGGPPQPEIVPEAARERILAAHPDLVTAHHPMAERWWEDFEGYTAGLLTHVEQTADVCRLAIELEPDLRLLCVDFMSSDFAGHLGYHRLDPSHPAHRPEEAGDELVQVYEAIDRACGELLEVAAERFGEEPTALVLSDHGMKPIHWVFHLNHWLEREGYLRYRRRSLQALRGGRLDFAARVDHRLGRTKPAYARMLDRLPLPSPRPDRAFADIDFGKTRAYCYGAGGQIFLGEASGALRDPGVARDLEQALTAVHHPETGQPAFSVARKEDLYSGPFVHKGPEFILLPLDERIFVEASRRASEATFERHDHLDPERHSGYSGHHGVRGILAAAGPGIRMRDVPEGAEITQVPATLLALLGLEGELEAPPIGEILDAEPPRRRADVAVGTRPTREKPVYSPDEEARMIERLRDLGYE
jgi:predicted AlkP superfamily phosphohydrolase/phosphomutase